MGNTYNHNIKIEHIKLQEGILSSDNELILDYKMFSNYHQWVTQIITFSKFNSRNILLLPSVQEAQTQNLCGSTRSLKLIFNVYRYTLFQEIKKRKDNNEKFIEQQLWFLMYNLLLGSFTFQKNQMKSGDIRPQNILLNQSGDITIFNRLTFPHEKTNYYKFRVQYQSTYLGNVWNYLFIAPEEIAQLENEVINPMVDPALAQSFSIGLTVLDAALLCNCQQLYEPKKLKFRNHQFNQHQLNLKQTSLSPFLVRTIRNLLEVKSCDRPSPGQALAVISPYQHSILQLLAFHPDKSRSKAALKNFQQQYIR